MSKNSRLEIRIAGFGGQGVVTIGKILGVAFSVYSGRNSVNTQSYGPESRGGACRSELIVSDGEINYPYVRSADVFVALSRVSFDNYIKELKKDGVLIIDPEAVEIDPGLATYRTYRIPVVRIAHETGNVKYLNSVALGGLSVVLEKFVSKEDLTQALSLSVPAKTLEANLSAFKMGRKFIKENYFEVH